MKPINQLGLNFYLNQTEEEFNLLYPVMENYIYNFITRTYIQLNEDDSKLLTDISIQQIWRKIEQFNPQFKFSTWICTIAKNYGKQFIDRRREYMYLDELESIDKLLPLKSYDTRTDKTDYQEKLEYLIETRLTEIEKEIVKKRIYKKMPIQEIADEFNVPLSIMKNRLYNIYKKLKSTKPLKLNISNTKHSKKFN